MSCRLWRELAESFKPANHMVFYAFWRDDFDSTVEEELGLQGAGALAVPEEQMVQERDDESSELRQRLKDGEERRH